MRWDYKFDIKHVSPTFPKNLSKSLNAKRELLKQGSSYSGNEDSIPCKTKLDNICDEKVEGLRIRSKDDWYKK